MIPPDFQYFAPQTLNEALLLLSQYGGEAKILSGGQSLIPLMKLRFAAPAYLIDINRIPDLNYIKEDGGFLRIGALVREADLENSEMVKQKYTILYDASKVIADPLVRNMATVCGNVAHGDPANDHPAVMIALNAEFIARGQKGERSLPARSFFTGPYATELQPDEILTEIRIPLAEKNSGGAYIKLERKVGDFAIAATAVQLTLKDNAVKQVGIGLTNVSDVPVQATDAEQFLQGKRLEENAIKQAAELAAAQSQPREDFRGSEEYRRDLVRVLTARTLRLAYERAKGGK